MGPPFPKMLLMITKILSVVLERTVRFVTTVDSVLEKYNNYLPNNKWLCVKLASTLVG